MGRLLIALALFLVGWALADLYGRLELLEDRVRDEHGPPVGLDAELSELETKGPRGDGSPAAQSVTPEREQEAGTD